MSSDITATSSTPPDPEEDLRRMTLSQHLDELRSRLFISIAAIVVGMLVSFIFHKEIWAFVQQPYLDAMKAAGTPAAEIKGLLALSPGEAFFQVLKLCFLVGAVVVGPIVLWQMWGFIAAGLYDAERRYVRIFFPVSILLFGLGVTASYKILIPFGLRFLIGFGQSLEVETHFRIEDYLSSCLTMTFAMGFVFLLPLVMLFVQAAGMVSRETFKKNWRWAVIFSVIVGMMLTDPSPITQVMMAIPIVGLYFLGIWGGRFVGSERERFRWYKAWPIVIGLGLFVAMIMYAEELNDLAADLFPSGGEKSAPETPGTGSGAD